MPFSTRQAGRWAIAAVGAFLAVGATSCGFGSDAPGGDTAPVAAEPGTPMVLPENLSHSIAALGWPGAKRAFQVGHGSVVFTGETTLEWRIAAQNVTTSPVYFEQDGVPVAHWTMEGAGTRIDFEAAAAPHEALGDTSLLLSVQATVTREEGGEGGFEVRVGARPDGPHFPAWDSDPTDLFQDAWKDKGAVRNGMLVAAVDNRASLPGSAPSSGNPRDTEGFGAGALSAICSSNLSAGQSRTWHFLVPAYPTQAIDANELRKTTHENVLNRARNQWRTWLNEAVVFESPDTLVNAAWRAALVTLIQCQERYGDDWVSIGNPFQYRDVWVRDGARVVRALAVAGLSERAQANAWSFRHFQLPHGAIISQRGQLDGTGQALWAMEQAASIPRNEGAARKFLPVAEKALQWIRRQRTMSRQIGGRYGNLLPFGDPRDAELVRANLTGNDAWTIAGCDAIVTLARMAGNDDLARTAYAEYQSYRQQFATALDRTYRDDIPGTYQQAGRDWGNLSVGYPTEALPPGHARVIFTAQRVWAGVRNMALVNYGPRDSLHSYLGADLANWALLARRPRIARSYVQDFLDYSSSTLGQAEIFHRRGGGFGRNMPPHTTAAATFVDLLRNMVICDVRDTLEIGLGGNLSWWSGTKLDAAPTRFGVIDVALERPSPDELHASWGATAAPVRIRVPDGAVAVSSLTPGVTVRSARWVECAPGLSRAAFRIREL